MKKFVPAVCLLIVLVVGAALYHFQIQSSFDLPSQSTDTEIVGHSETEWLQELAFENSTARTDAARALAGAGEKGLAVLIKGLRSRGSRSGAVEGLIYKGRSAVVPLEPVLRNDSDEAVRAAAAEVMANIGGEPSRPLAMALRDKSVMVRFRAANVLKRGAEKAGFAVDELCEVLLDDDSNVRSEARVALSIMPTTEAVPALLRRLTDARPKMRSAAARQFSDLHLFDKPDLKAEAVKGLLPLLNDSDSQVALAAASSLHHWEPGRDVMPVLKRALTDIRADVRNTALFELGLTQHGPAATKLAAASLDDRDAGVRAAAVDALKHAGENIGPYMPALVRRLEDQSTDVRVATARALGEIRRLPKVAVPGLTAALNDKSDEVRSEAEYALAEFGAEAAPARDALLERFKTDRSASVRSNAVYALGGIGIPANAATPAILAAIRELPRPPKNVDIVTARDYGYRLSGLVRALGRMAPRDPEAIVLLTGIVSDETQHPLVRTEAASALGQIGAPAKSSFDALLHASRAWSDELRRASSDACFKVDPEAAKRNATWIGRKRPNLTELKGLR